MTPEALLRHLIDATDALANRYRAQLALLECKKHKRDPAGCKRMLRERKAQWERAKEKLDAAMTGRAA